MTSDSGASRSAETALETELDALRQKAAERQERAIATVIDSLV